MVNIKNDFMFGVQIYNYTQRMWTVAVPGRN